LSFYFCEISGKAAIRFQMDIEKDGTCPEFEEYCQTGQVIVYAPNGKLVSDAVALRVAKMFGDYLEGRLSPQATSSSPDLRRYNWWRNQDEHNLD